MPLKLPTPPTPPTIDKGEAVEHAPMIDAHQLFQMPIPRKSEPVAQEEKPLPKSEPRVVERHSPTPEQAARDAVAQGAGSMTKREVTRPEIEKPANVMQVPPVSNLEPDNSNRGKEILREFQREDMQFDTQTADTPRPVKLNLHETHGGFYWIVTLILVIVASVVFVKKFLISDKPALKKSDLFSESSERLKATAEKVSAPIKKSPPKKDDDKSKHFEVRI